jgi:4'-phosphopantetheinyl transferase EntD
MPENQDLIDLPDWVRPKNVTLCCAENWMWQTPARPAEEALWTGASVKRQREFRAGRHCARAALKLAGHSSETAIMRGARGEPLWPAGYCGSITHSGDACVAAVAEQTKVLALGIDIERHRTLKPGIVEKIATDAEREQLQKMHLAQAETAWATVLFSIKECVHKVYYPLNHHQLGFHDVCVMLDTANKSFRVKIENPAQEAVVGLTELRGQFATSKDYVMACITVPVC